MSLRVTPEQLQNLSGNVLRTSAEVRGAHSGLRAQLTPVLGADWSGVAASQFAMLYQQFEGHAAGLSDALDGIGRLLAQAGASYADVEQRITAAMR